MADELSAYSAYSKMPRPKKAAKKAPKQIGKRAPKKSPPKRNNGPANKRQNGVQKTKPQPKKMNSTPNSSASGSANSTKSTTDSSEELNNTAAIAQQMAKLISKRGEQNFDSDGDSSDGSYGDFESDSVDCGSESGDQSGSESECGCEDNETTQSASGNSSAQFSEEYTLDSNASGSNSSMVSASSPPRSPSPSSAAPAPRRKASKRSELFSSDAEGSDLNNNSSKNKNKPPSAKQQKLEMQQKLKEKRQQAQEQRAAAAVQREKAAPSCPLPRPSLNAAVKSCPLPSKAPKAATKAAPKSCRLPTKKVDKMATNSCPLPPKKETKKQPQQQQEQEPKATRKANEEKEPPRPPVHQLNSIAEGKRVLFWLLNPMKPEEFFSKYWERNACQVKRKQSQYFSQLISFKMIDEMLIRNHLEFTTNIDVTSYKNGVRETLNPDGRAMPPTVWGHYGDGCSIRILNPSTYLGGLRQLCSVMQEYFHCLVGANVYLTPPNSQGFAPHYDDIEAFVLQVEGRKRWRLYAPPLPSDLLARVSSGNYAQDQLGPPIFDAVLEPGDILYFPRGTVHQAVTEQQQHSLHITLSVYQQLAYANLLEQLMPAVLQRAIKHHLSLRRGLPLHTWQHLGLARGGQTSEPRTQLLDTTKRLVQQYLMPSDTQIDAAVDQLAKRFQHEALPPVVLPEEQLRTVFGSRSQTDAKGQCLCDYDLNERTRVRLLRANILRLVAEGSSLRVYYYVDNALEYCKHEANFMEIQATEAAAVEALISAYPNYLKIASLPLRSADRRIEVATALWERGLLMTEKPFKEST